MNSPVIFFDDLCVLCSRSVQFIYRNDIKKRFYFASLESEAFNGISGQFNQDKSIPKSVILYDNGKVYSRSGAALRIAWRLRFPLPLLALALIVPPFLRNAFYDWIARKRYAWFGKRDTCFIPENDLKTKFLK